MTMAARALTAPVRQIRLLIVNSTLHIGGAEEVAACLAAGISDEKCAVSACYLKEPGLVAEQMLRSGVDLVPIPGLVPGRRDYLTSLKLKKLIGQRDIQIIHTHDIHGLIDAAACRTMLRSVRHIHTFHFGNYPHRRLRHKLIEGTLWRIPDVLVAVGHEQARSIRDFYGIPENRLRVIWNGVKDPIAGGEKLRLDIDTPPGTPIIASISTLIEQKGLSFLLEAAALLKQSGEPFRLLIAGDGALKEPLHAQCRNLGLTQHVRFLGWVPQASRRVLPACDIFVQSSLWEAMSVVVLEAMAAAKPMVVTTVGENSHVVLDGQTGMTVPPSSATALADSLRTLLRDPELRSRLGAAARARYEAHFTIQHMISAHEELYREVARSIPANAAPITAA